MNLDLFIKGGNLIFCRVQDFSELLKMSTKTDREQLVGAICYYCQHSNKRARYALAPVVNARIKEINRYV